MLFYRLLISGLWGPVAAVLLLRVLAGRETFSDWRERVGLRVLRADGPHVWLHAASNGELASARPVLDAIRRNHPDVNVLITTNSLSGRKMARALDIDGVSAQLAPLDTRWAANRLLNSCQVAAFIVMEAEFWPNRIAAAQMRGFPVLVLGARLSRKSARMWRRLAFLARDIQSRITFLSPQDDGSRRRFLRLGASAAQIGPVLDLKAFYIPTQDHQPDAALQSVFRRADTWLAASTHPGEDEIVLEAHRAARQVWPGLQLIIAPRHPSRGAHIARMARDMGFGAALRSKSEPPRRDAVYVADTLGEMDQWYAASGMTFVGGSLVARGGHTPYEPAGFDSAILHGPDTGNFRAAYRHLEAAGAAIRIEDAASLCDALLALRAADRANDMRRAARAALYRPAQLDAILDAVKTALSRGGTM